MDPIGSNGTTSTHDHNTVWDILSISPARAGDVQTKEQMSPENAGT